AADADCILDILDKAADADIETGAGRLGPFAADEICNPDYAPIAIGDYLGLYGPALRAARQGEVEHGRAAGAGIDDIGALVEIGRFDIADRDGRGVTGIALVALFPLLTLAVGVRPGPFAGIVRRLDIEVERIGGDIQ